MKMIIILLIVFLVGCLLTFFVNGKPEPGYEKLWIAMIPAGGILFIIPVLLYLLIGLFLK